MGAAVKVTLLPKQKGFVGVEIDKLTGRFGFTVIVKGRDVAGLFVGQAALDRTVQVIISPLSGT